ncbi:MAG: universal stress protein [Deltaproteobacteria bacterium]|nr:universal stress protein [Deltaproteobacteria bacterium]
MTDKTKKKMLLAVDGSENSLEIVRYAAKIPAFREMATVLYNVRSKIPEGYWDLEKNGSAAWRISEARVWEKEHDKVIQGCMLKAENILKRAGFPKESVEVKIHNRKSGFARDIAKEAKQGYDGVMVGRKGMSNLKDFVLGSIATKLIEKISFIPILVVGKNPETGSVLLALDGSENATRAVDYVGKILGGSDYAATLIHVIRSDNPEYVNERKMEMNGVFDEAREALITSGFNPDRITTKIITGARSRAAAVAQEAREGGYGTIVVGRRGLSRVRDFLMGRVSNKLIHLAKNQAVWVVD